MRILIADDHDIVRLGVRSLLEEHGGWQVVGEAATGRDAVEKSGRLKPDVLVLDANLPELSGAEAARAVLECSPATRVLVLTMDESPALMRDLVRAGVHGYVFKADLAADLVAGVEALSQNLRYFTSRVAEMMYQDYLHPQGGNEEQLTPRQLQIVKLLAEGKTNKEVANALDISVKTAETHRNNIMRRLDLESFSDLVRYAVRHGLVEG